MFNILSATGGITGEFNTWPEWLPALSDGLQWEINYGTNDVVLAVVADALLGDYSGNGVIDAADYTVWRDAMGAGATTLTNDATPGTVDGNDYSYWKTHFGEPLGSGARAAEAAVPEPASLVLLSRSLRWRSALADPAAGAAERTERTERGTLGRPFSIGNRRFGGELLQ